MFEAKKHELIKLIAEKSYYEGKFTLSSGKKSSFYLDLKELTLDRRGMQLVGELGCLFLQNNKIKVRAVGGMCLGADPIAMAIAMLAPKYGMELDAFIVRKTPKKHGSSAWMEGVKGYACQEKLLLLEDVVTTAASGIRSVKIVQEAGFEALALMTIVDREEGAKEACEKEAIPFFSLCTLREIREKSRVIK